MPFQAPDGTWWSDDRRHYRVGDQWVPYQDPSTASSQHVQPSSKEASDAGAQLGNVSASTVTAALSVFPQTSEPSHHQPPLVFGKNRQTPGKPAVPAITLDPHFREAASRNMMIWGFVQAADKTAKGSV